MCLGATEFSGDVGQLVPPPPHSTVTTKVIPVSRIPKGMGPALKAVALASALSQTGAVHTEKRQLEEKCHNGHAQHSQALLGDSASEALQAGSTTSPTSNL